MLEELPQLPLPVIMAAYTVEQQIRLNMFLNSVRLFDFNFVLNSTVYFYKNINIGVNKLQIQLLKVCKLGRSAVCCDVYEMKYSSCLTV